MSDDRKIDREKFERALARAVELATEREDQLGTGDLVDTARQLGIDERTALSALAEVEGRPPEVERPYDTRITFESGVGRLRLAVPARGLGAASLPALGFSLFWLAFVAFWTWGAAHGSWLFACFSIPFWLVGGSMLVGALNEAYGTEELSLDGERGELVQRLGPFVRRRAIEKRHVTLRRIEAATRGSGRSERTTPAHLQLGHGTQSFRLLTGRSDAELAWIEDGLSRWLGRS